MEFLTATIILSSVVFVFFIIDINGRIKKLLAHLQFYNWRSKNTEEIILNDELEKSLNITGKDSFDSIEIWATSATKCCLHVKFAKMFGRMAEISIILTLPDGKIYRLPTLPDSMVFDANSNTWSGGNLKIILLEPYKRWRIIFNGPMVENDEKLTTNVRLNFIWIAASDPMRTPDDCSTALTGSCIESNSDCLKNISYKGYTQFGNMTGIVNINNQVEPTTYSLASVKFRRWGANYSTYVQNSSMLIGIANDGAIFALESNGIEKAPWSYGFVREPTNLVSKIDSIQFNMMQLQQSLTKSKENLRIVVRANDKNFDCDINVNYNDSTLLRGGRPWNWESSMYPTKIKINDCDGLGIIDLRLTYTGDCPLTIPPEIKPLQYTDCGEIPNDIVCVKFDEEMCRCSQFVGAKGASLALLSSVETKEFKVPPGFCLTICALDDHIHSSSIFHDSIKSIEEINENYDEDQLKERCEKVCKLFLDTPLLSSLKEKIEQHFIELCKRSDGYDKKFFAVRSSGIGEDSEELSAAGQNLTVLGCKTLPDIFDAIQKCWASLFTFQSVEYRRQHGQKLNCGMGVVVQAMVDADAAGVLFTRHPSTGDPETILITSNYGLGETVVSGQVDPDHIYLERSIQNELKIKETVVGTKMHKMFLDKNESSVKMADLNDDSKVLSLSAVDCLKLGRIAIDQELLWGSPRDVEWVISKGVIYLVQARPITTLQSWSEYELLHELDSAVMSDVNLVTFANTGEVLPNAISPLSNSIVTHRLDIGLCLYQQEYYYEYASNAVFCTHHRMTLDVFNTMLKYPEKEISISNKVSDYTLYGHDVTDSNLHSIAVKRNGIVGRLKTVIMLSKMIKMLWHKEKLSKHTRDMSEKFKIDLEKCNSMLDKYNEINKHLPEIITFSNFHGQCSTASFFSQLIFFSILLEGGNDFTSDHYSDIGMVLSSCLDVISAEVPTKLKKLASLIYESGKSNEFCRIEAKKGIEWLKANCPMAFDEFQVFLKNHGHRSLMEFDLMTETWSIRPENLITALQTTLLYPLKEERKVENLDLVSKFKSPKKSVTRKILKAVIPTCQKAVACRETTKAAFVLAIHKFRLAYRNLAKDMVKQWLLPDENLLFYFTNFELGNYLESRDPAIVNKALLRRRYFPKWNTFKFDELQWGNPKPMNTSHPVFIESEKCPIVNGTPVCPGSVVGRACVVHHLSEINQLRNGDILITRATDIGWSPYFPLLGGVVTELGGLISHGAVVAREYGLPCIVGAQNATSMFSTGDTVLLDSSRGLIQKVEEES